MFGILSLCQEEHGRGSAIRCHTEMICGICFFKAAVRCGRNTFLMRRRLRRAALLMKRAGVHTALFPEQFSEDRLFEKYGVRRAKEAYLRKMTAGQIACRAMAERGINAALCPVALLGDRMTAPLRKALMEIALHARCTMLCAGGGGGEACSVLRRDYGVSVLRNAGEEQLCRAGVVLTFDAAVPCGRKDCLWLPFGTVTQAQGYENAFGTVRYAAPPEIEKQIPDDCCRNALLSLLLELGILHAGDLEVVGVVQNA